MVLGKTIFISILSRIIKAKKILVIDFDLVNNNLYTMYGVNSIPRSMKDKLKDDEYLFSTIFSLAFKQLNVKIMAGRFWINRLEF